MAGKEKALARARALFGEKAWASEFGDKFEIGDLSYHGTRQRRGIGSSWERALEEAARGTERSQRSITADEILHARRRRGT